MRSSGSVIAHSLFLKRLATESTTLMQAAPAVFANAAARRGWARSLVRRRAARSAVLTQAIAQHACPPKTRARAAGAAAHRSCWCPRRAPAPASRAPAGGAACQAAATGATPAPEPRWARGARGKGSAGGHAPDHAHGCSVRALGRHAAAPRPPWRCTCGPGPLPCRAFMMVASERSASAKRPLDSSQRGDSGTRKARPSRTAKGMADTASRMRHPAVLSSA